MKKEEEAVAGRAINNRHNAYFLSFWRPFKKFVYGFYVRSKRIRKKKRGCFKSRYGMQTSFFFFLPGAPNRLVSTRRIENIIMQPPTTSRIEKGSYPARTENTAPNSDSELRINETRVGGRLFCATIWIK